MQNTIETNTVKVTIGLPVFNGAKFLDKSIKSLLNQTYTNFELIISDNCSTDETESICTKYSELDHRIIYIKQNENIGAYKNFLFTLNQARYEYFMWAAADDEWHSDFLKKNLQNFSTNNKVVVSFCNVECINNQIKNVKEINFQKLNQLDYKFDLIKELLTQKKYNFFIYGLFRKDILKKCFSNEIDFVDRWLLLPMILEGYKVAVVNDVLYYRTIYNDKINERHSKKLSKINVSHFTLLKSSWYSSYWIKIVLNRSLTVKEILFIKYYSIKYASYKILKHIYSFI